VDVVLDDDVARALRRCAQKSSTSTKLKALRELEEALFDGGGDDASVGGETTKASVEALAALSRPWARAYDKLAGDGDVGCRREASALNGRIAVACGKGLGKILKSTPLVSAWVKAMCDPVEEAAAAATAAFERTFSTDERRRGAMAHAHDVILDDLVESLGRRGPGDMIFRDGSESEQFARFDLSVRSALAALAFTCERLCAHASAESDAAADKFNSAMNSLSQLKVQIKGEFSSIRREAYSTLDRIVKASRRDDLTPAWRRALRDQMPKIAATSLALISSETEPGGIRDMWELILGVITTDAEAWNAVDVEKQFIPGVRKHFKRGCYGAASVSSPSLLPLLAHMPPRTLIERGADGAPMAGLRGVLDAVFAGWSFLSASAVRANEAREILPALREGVLYGVLKLAPLTDHAEECATRVCVDDIADRWMRAFLSRGDARALDLMRDALDIMATKPHATTAVVEAWSALGDITERALEDETTGEHAYTMFSRVIASGATASASAAAVRPFAKAVFARAVDHPTTRSVDRLAALVDSLGVDAFDGAQRVMDFCLSEPAPPGAGAVVAAVLKHDATRWRAVLDRAATDETEDDECVRTVVDILRATKTPASLACDALDALARRCARRRSASAASADFLRVVFRHGAVAALSRDAAIDAYESMASGERDASARCALMTGPPPSDASDVVAAWAAAVGAAFGDALRESQTTVECVIHEASSDDEDEFESEDEIEYVQTREGEAERDWRAIERAAASGETLAPETRDALALGVTRAAARAARSQSPGESELVLRLWARRTATALRAFGVDDDGVVRFAVDEVAASASAEAADVNFHWLNALARAFGWTPILLAMRDDARRVFIADGLRATTDASRAFTTTTCGAGRFRAETFRHLLDDAVASDDASHDDDALLTFARRASKCDAEWTNARENVESVRRFLDAVESRLETFSPRLARLLPWVLPASDMSGGDHAKGFIATVVQRALRNVENRRVGLDGSALTLLAACFSRGDDLDADAAADAVPRSLECASCAPLVDVFRAISKREAGDAAARAAAARFGGDAMETDAGAADADAGIAALTRAVARRCAAELDARDWGAVIGRLDAWTSTRAKKAETYAANDDDDDDDDDDGAAAMRDAAATVRLIDGLPMELSEPTTASSSGDVVPYAARGAAAMKIASALAAAAWPSERAEIVSRMFACVALAGAELKDVEEENDAKRRVAFWTRARRERRMWEGIACIACGAAPITASASLAGTRVDECEDAPFETVASLYQLLSARGASSAAAADATDASDALRRAAYGLLASDALVRAAVVGLDASIADVDKVERALDAGIAAADADDDADVSNFGTPAESAGVREDLAALLSTTDADSSGVVALGWALFFRYLLRLPADSSCRERLINYSRETKAIPNLMRDVTRGMPLPDKTDGDACEDDLPSAWRGVDWDDPTSPAQIFDARLSRDVLLYAAALRALPASVRTFVSDMKPQRDAKRLAVATAATVSPALLAAEFRAVAAYSFAAAADGSGSLTVKPSTTAREVIARYEIDESALELIVRLPDAYPLAPAELVCEERVGVSEARLRKWMLGIAAILKHQNGAVAQGLDQWRRNIDAEFAGVDPCPICYAVIHPVDHQKPRLRCRQCDNKFHAACLYTWFRTSSKSSCPLCVTPWGSSYR